MNKECKDCDGWGEKYCVRCDGEGTINPPWKDDCPDCTGEGYVRCPACEGKCILDYAEEPLTEDREVEIIR